MLQQAVQEQRERWQAEYEPVELGLFDLTETTDELVERRE